MESSLLVYDEPGYVQFNKRLVDYIISIDDRYDEAVRFLENCINPGHAKDSSGQTLLHIAAKNCNYKVVRFLIDGGAQVDAQDLYGKTPLMRVKPYYSCITHLSARKTVKVLLKANANVQMSDKNGLSVIEYFLGTTCDDLILQKLSDDYSGDKVKIAKKLMDINCSIYAAISLKNANVTRLLIDLGCPLTPANRPELGKADVLVRAVGFNYIGNVVLLVNSGIDVNSENIDGNTCLSTYGHHVANLNGAPKLLRLLLDYGANPTMIMKRSRFMRGKMQMFTIMKYGEIESIQMVLESLKDWNVKDKFGCTALHYLVRNIYAKNLDVLKDRGFNVNVRNNDGSTPLHHMNDKNLAGVKFLLDSGADVNAQDQSGTTPILKIWQNLNSSDVFLFSMEEKTEIEQVKRVIDCLLYYGADIRVFFLSYFFNLPFYRPLCLYWMESAVAKLAVLEEHGGVIEEFIKNQISKHAPLKIHFQDCKRQLKRMRQVNLTKTISLYKIFTASDAKLELYAKKFKLLMKLRQLRNKGMFDAYYHYILRDRVVKTVKKVKRKRETEAVLCDIIGIGTGHIVSNKIVNHLTDNDLQKMYGDRL